MTNEELARMVNVEQMGWREVERVTGMSRQGIWKRLKKAGLYEPRCAVGGAASKIVKMPCGFCGELVTRYRSRVARAEQMAAYCTQACYAAKLAQSPYREWRRGGYVARALVAKQFPLQREHIVHHKDGDQRNNAIQNLMVFETQADHLAYHRGRAVTPIFDGGRCPVYIPVIQQPSHRKEPRCS